MTPTTTLTELLSHWDDGPVVHERVMPIVYREVRAVAESLFFAERRNHTLQPTELVGEAYLRIRGGGPWKNRAHFFGSISRAMRCVLVDHARRRNAQKRGGDLERVDVDDLQIRLTEPFIEACYEHSDILAVDDAIEQLKLENPRWASIVELRFFAGLSVRETASTLCLCEATVQKDWSRASRWLKEYLTEHEQTR